MTNLNFFLVSYDRLEERVISNLTTDEIKCVKCYAVQKKIPKSIINKVDIINEWELEWNDYTYQSKQYYEYGSMVHLLNNDRLIKNLTHIGLLHYDTLFNKNSISEIINKLNHNPNQIFYQRIRGINDLYLTKQEVDNICLFMQERLEMKIDSEYIWTNGWISEALSVTPVEVFKKFAKFLMEYKNDIEDILLSNRWGIMNVINHRVCGIVERMWGFYLVSLNLQLTKMNIEHDWDYYIHKHQTEENWIKLK